MTHKGIVNRKQVEGGKRTDALFVWEPACFISCREIKELQLQFSFRTRVLLQPGSDAQSPDSENDPGSCVHVSVRQKEGRLRCSKMTEAGRTTDVFFAVIFWEGGRNDADDEWGWGGRRVQISAVMVPSLQVCSAHVNVTQLRCISAFLLC